MAGERLDCLAAARLPWLLFSLPGGALLGGAVASEFGLTTPYWAGFVVAIVVTALTWRVFDRAVVSAAYAEEPSVSR